VDCAEKFASEKTNCNHVYVNASINVLDFTLLHVLKSYKISDILKYFFKYHG
jgi:hypothetical protein